MNKERIVQVQLASTSPMLTIKLQLLALVVNRSYNNNTFYQMCQLQQSRQLAYFEKVTYTPLLTLHFGSPQPHTSLYTVRTRTTGLVDPFTFGCQYFHWYSFSLYPRAIDRLSQRGCIPCNIESCTGMGITVTTVTPR